VGSLRVGESVTFVIVIITICMASLAASYFAWFTRLFRPTVSGNSNVRVYAESRLHL